MNRSDAAGAALGERDRAVVLAAIDQDLRAGEVRRRIGLRVGARLDRRQIAATAAGSGPG